MDFISTSSIAFGEHLGQVMDRADANGVQIALGPRPCPGNALEMLAEHVEAGVTLRAHANCPLGPRLMNQERDFGTILANCVTVGIGAYTLHAPRKRNLATLADFQDWAFGKWAAASASGVDFAVETMYPADAPYWLDSYREVMQFLDWARSQGWEKPLATDVAHLQIGVVQGTWTEDQVERVLRSGAALEFHYSDNDGVHDNHKPYVAGINNRIDKWVTIARTHQTVMVNEGRYRR